MVLRYAQGNGRLHPRGNKQDYCIYRALQDGEKYSAGFPAGALRGRQNVGYTLQKHIFFGTEKRIYAAQLFPLGAGKGENSAESDCNSVYGNLFYGGKTLEKSVTYGITGNERFALRYAAGTLPHGGYLEK